MVAGPIVGEAIGGPEDSCLCVDNGELDNRLWWTSLRCSLSQSMVGEVQEKKNCPHIFFGQPGPCKNILSDLGKGLERKAGIVAMIKKNILLSTEFTPR